MSQVYRTNGERGRVSTRRERGIALAEERFEQITKVRPWTWSVPSADGRRKYEVNLRHEACSCADNPPEGESCKHVVAARYVRSRTGQCVSCRGRFRDRDLFPVPEDHSTYYESEMLCRPCALLHGVL